MLLFLTESGSAWQGMWYRLGPSWWSVVGPAEGAPRAPTNSGGPVKGDWRTGGCVWLEVSLAAWACVTA